MKISIGKNLLNNNTHLYNKFSINIKLIHLLTTKFPFTL